MALAKSFSYREREREMDFKNEKGRVCVTGGTGFLGSWMVKRLLEEGYIVNTTARIDPDRKRDISYLTNLPGASERLHIFNADLDKPDTFAAAIKGCIGVFHMAHPLDLYEKESEEVKLKRVLNGLQGILQVCVDSTTVKQVIYTSSATTVILNQEGLSHFDESSWTDVEFLRSSRTFIGPYAVTKTLTEKAAIEFSEKNGLDLVVVNPTWISGPFICPTIPDSVNITLALFFGAKEQYPILLDFSLVHVDDVARAHVYLFENPKAKGRYICSALEVRLQELVEFISARYPEYKMPTKDSLKDINIPILQSSGLSSKKLLDTGFKYENGLEEIFDGALESCKKRGFL